MRLTKKICILEQLRVGVSYGAAGQEFDVNESTVCINKVSLNRNTQTIRFCADGLGKTW